MSEQKSDQASSKLAVEKIETEEELSAIAPKLYESAAATLEKVGEVGNSIKVTKESLSHLQTATKRCKTEVTQETQQFGEKINEKIIDELEKQLS